MNKNTLNYWVDAVIGIAFTLSAVSGLVFLLPVDPLASNGILGIGLDLWNLLHTWSSLALIAGVGAHLVLHWRWIVAMTRRTFTPKVQSEVAGSISAGGVSRRQFLRLGGITALVAGLAVTGYKVYEAIFDAGAANAAGQEGGVACPFGVVNDPYPGRCRFYTDSNGDGICDYSAPNSDSNSVSSQEGRRHGPGWRQP